MMKKTALFVLVILLSVTLSVWSGGEKESDGPVTLRIATVNNPDMVVMEQLSDRFTEQTGIELEFVVLPENELRQQVTEDVSLGGGQYDIVTIGTYDTPFWGRNGWVLSLEQFFSDMSSAERQAYDRDDMLAPIRSALSFENEQYALPFYGESSMLYYRTDIMEEHGIEVPTEPTWQEILEIAREVHDPSNDRYGIVLRGLPGWGQNMAVFGSIINTFGARWYNMEWEPQFDTPEMREAWQFYKTIVNEAGEPGPTSVGFTEALALMQNGNGAMWYDATVAAGMLASDESQVQGDIGYALAPTVRKDNSGWLWAWSLGITASSRHPEEAFEFITWATSKEYIQLVGEELGWGRVPPGTRVSTYENPSYQDAAPFAEITLRSIRNANYSDPTVDPVPYVGVQYVAIPEFQSLGEVVSQELAAYISGQRSLDAALENSQEAAREVAVEGGYQ